MKAFLDFGIYCTFAQFVHSDTAIREGLENIPDEEQYDNGMIVYENVIVPIVKHFGVAPGVNSFFRSGKTQKTDSGIWTSVNAIVGGSPTSDHPNGRAVDLSFRFVKTPYTNIDLGRFVRDNLDFDQLIIEKIDPLTFRPAWVHVGYRSKATNRHQIFEAKFKPGDKTAEKYVAL